MRATTFKMDYSRGFDVMRGRTVLYHTTSYTEAVRLAGSVRGGYVRYYWKKES